VRSRKTLLDLREAGRRNLNDPIPTMNQARNLYELTVRCHFTQRTYSLDLEPIHPQRDTWLKRVKGVNLISTPMFGATVPQF
jgi:hypothetical protein